MNKIKIMVFLHGTTIMHKTAFGVSAKERLKQVARGDKSVCDQSSYVPIGNVIKKLKKWKAQGADILYLSPLTKSKSVRVDERASEKDFDGEKSVLLRYGFPKGRLYHRKTGEQYKDIVEKAIPDVLIEDDCKSIGGVKEMSITYVRSNIKKKIVSMIVKEFNGIDNLPDDIHDFGVIHMDIIKLNRKAWDKIGKRHTVAKYYKNKMIDLFLRKLSKGSRILDLGCGGGVPITKRLVDSGFDVVGIDLSETMIELAKKNVPEATFTKISMTDITFKKEFDGVLSNFSMLCLNKRLFNSTAKRIVRALKNGGYFLLVLNETPPQGHTEKASYVKIMNQIIYSRPYDESDIRKIFGKLGLKILKVARKIVISKKYGKEYMLSVLMRKM
ncbi:MAG: methyltransferase domain-containing protein [Candidatus Aenigmatarchaeota archaeon]